MQKLISIILLSFVLLPACAQQKKVTGYLLAEYNKTIYDRTKANNPWGMGLAFQLFFNTTSKLKPTIDLAATAYLEDDKVLRLDEDGSPVEDIGGMLNLFAGVSWEPVDKTYVSLVAGPGFVSGRTLFGLKPSVGLYFDQKKKWTGKISYINLFDRDKTSKKDFGSINLAIGVKLF